MNDEDEEIRSTTANAIEELLRANGLVADDAIVAGWVVCFETIGADGDKTAGHLEGPHEMSTWRVMGLMEWVLRYCLGPGPEVDD